MFGKAILNGLHYYRDAQASETTTDGDIPVPREADRPQGELPPMVKAEVPRPADLPPGPGSSGDQLPLPPPAVTEGKGVGKEVILIKAAAPPGEGNADPRPRSRAGSYHSARSDLREERM